MNENNSVRILIDQLNKTVRIINEIKTYHNELHKREIKMLGKGTASASLLADVFVSFYTCCETAFVRISQFFENNLEKKRWHKDLLDRMTLEINDIRPRVLRDETKLALDELLRFRHFKRYYFEFNYDWDRIEFIDMKFKKTTPLIKEDLTKFCVFLEKITA